MSIGEIAALIVACPTAIGLIITLVRNGRHNTNERIVLETNLKAEIAVIKNDIASPEHGLAAIKKAQQDQVLYCIKTSEPIIAKNREMEGRIERVEKRISGI